MSEQKSSFSERAMLVHLRIRMWTGVERDGDASEEYCTSKGAERDAGSFYINFLPKQDVRALQSANQRMRNEFKRLTLPFYDGGMRVVSSDMYLDFASAMRKAREEYLNVVDTFLTESYPNILTNMPERLKGLLGDRQMPKASELRKWYDAKISTMPVPSTKDFRTSLSADVEAEIRKEAEDSMKEMMARTMQSVWGKLQKMVCKLEEKLKDTDKKLTDAVFCNLIQLCIDLPKLNLTGDENLEKMRQEVIDHLCKLDPATLKKDKGQRKNAAKEAKAIIDKMKAYAMI